MKLLIIEDEVKAGSYLKKGFIESGYIVDLSTDGVDGLYNATTNHYDLIILDVMLPKLSGWQVLKTMRSSDINTPVIMLTARDQVEDRVKGLELGANDYMIKPFSFIELLARVKNALRTHKVSSEPDTVLSIADLSMDLLRRTVHRNNDLILLTAKEFSLLELFLTKQGKVFSRSTIASIIWDMNFDSDTNVIDVVVKRLRAKIDKPYGVKLIHTVRGMGYKIDCL
tara:strand:+ start:40992 stop:41669 length:678 start_codon:yes stop_codon:yes gene_type:complete